MTMAPVAFGCGVSTAAAWKAPRIQSSSERDAAFPSAFDRAFNEVFRYELPDVGLPSQGIVAPATLAGDGALYLVAEHLARPNLTLVIDLVAIQTPSPGLARTGWAAPRYDQGASGWAQ
jgi:hypothetical protein